MKRSLGIGLVAILVLGCLIGGLVMRRRTRQASAPAGASTVRAGDGASADDGGGGRTAAQRPDAATDAALAPSEPDLVAAAGKVATGLYECRTAAEGWGAGRQALGKLVFSLSGTLLRGELVNPSDGAPVAGLESARACFGRVMAGSGSGDAGTEVTVWWPLVFADAAPDGGWISSQQMPSIDLLVVPSPYQRTELPKRGTDGVWLGLCAEGKQRPSWRPVTLSRTTDEENDDFDDVAVAGCGADPRFVPAVRGSGLRGPPTAARVPAGARAALGEKAIRFGGRQFRVWQEKVDPERSAIVLMFGRDLQVLLPDVFGDWDFDVAWAGDLDGDGHLDLIVRDGEDDEPRFTLFLSSTAPPRLPVGRTSDAQIPGD